MWAVVAEEKDLAAPHAEPVVGKEEGTWFMDVARRKLYNENKNRKGRKEVGM